MLRKITSINSWSNTFRVAAILLLVVVGLGKSLQTLAQSNGLGITPKLSYTVKPGEELSDTLYVNNLSTTQILKLDVKVVDFNFQDETGTPKLLLGKNDPSTPWSLKPYITLPSSITIDPGKSKLVPFTIKFPSGIGAGSYYSAVEYVSSNTGSAEQVNVAASSATLLFVNVPGNAKELISLAQFGVYQDDKFKSILQKRPTTFAYRLKNDGNVNERPAGTLIIKNVFGKVVASIENVNPLNELALIGQTRRFEVCNPKNTTQENLGKSDNCQPLNIKPGKYQAELVLLYGENGQESRQISAKATFWYLPLWFIIVFAIAVIAVLAGLYWSWHRFATRRHRHRHPRP